MFGPCNPLRRVHRLEMACHDNVAEAQAAQLLYREGLLRDFQDSLVSICLKRAAVVSCEAARAAAVFESVSRDWAEWAARVDSESSAKAQVSSMEPHGR